MLRLKNLTNKYQKRLVRPLYAQTQATPYAATLHASLRVAATGAIRVPLTGDTANGATNPFSVNRTATVFTLNNSIIPGLIMVRVTTAGEQVAVATGGAVAEVPFGLLANFVGGDLDDGFSSDTLQNSVGVWRGPDSVFELIAPAFNDTGAGNTNGQSLTAALAAATSGTAVALYAGADGRLSAYSTPPANAIVVAHLLDRPNASRIVIDLKI